MPLGLPYTVNFETIGCLINGYPLHERRCPSGGPEYHSQDIESIPLDELSSLTNVNYKFIPINRKHRIDDFDFNLVNFRDTSLLVDENIIDDLENST